MERFLIWSSSRRRAQVGRAYLDKPRGFGFVTFKEEEPFKKVLAESHELNGKIVPTSNLA
jgi:hypothetical protein